jgi:hypothetical protein
VEVLRAADVDGAEAVDLWTAMFTGIAIQQISNDPGGDRWTRLVDDAVDMVISCWTAAERPSANRR